MIIDKDEWKEWCSMSTTKQFVEELNIVKNDVLHTLPLHLANDRDRVAIIDSGIVRGLDLVIDIIHSKKEESAKDE